jgi:hypothetical protein
MSEVGKLWVSITAKTDEFVKGLNGVQDKMTSMGKNMQALGGSMTKYVTVPMIAAAGALFAGAVKAGNYADELLDLSAVTGVHTDQLQRWRYMAVAAGTDTDAVADALTRMNRQMVEGDEFGKRLEQTAESYGVALRDANGNVREGTAVITDLMMAVAAIEDPAERARVGAQAFGRDWQAIAPVVDLGTEAIQKWNAQEVIDNQKLQDMNAFREKWDLLKASMSLAILEVVGEYIPILTELVDKLKGELGPIVENIKDKIIEWVDAWNNLTPGTQKLIGILLLIIAAAGPLLIIFGQIAIGIGALIPLIGFLLSPIGLIIIAIVALVAGLIYLWNTNEGFRNAVIAIWEAIKAKGMAIFGALQAFWEKHGEAIKTVFQAAWDQIKNIFETVVAIIGGIIKFWAALFSGDVSGAMEAAKGIFKAAWDFIVGSVKNFASALGAVWGTIKSAASAAWSGIVSAIKTKANEIRTSVITAVNAAITWLKGLPGQMTSIGRNIIQGLINGIRNAGSSLAGALKGIVDAAIRNVKRLLGISSPSKVFEGLGINVGAGFVSGIEGMQGAVGNAMQGMVSPEMSIAAEASNSSTMVIKHEIDLKNVPETVDGASLENSLMNMLNNPQIKRRLDRISYENTVAARGLGI